MKDYEKLIEIDGWTFCRDHRGGIGEEYRFISHDACPLGVQLEVDRGKGECSVVHYMYQRCQRCKAFPPDGLMALYLLEKWEPYLAMKDWKGDL